MSIDINALLDRKIEFPKTLDYFLYGGFILGLLTFLYTLSNGCLLYTSPRPRDRQKSRMPSSA